ncbi:MAG: hypothetical protein A3A80_01315 [Candidatus Terrybacteria bacterium RIFCSPLOWO2_01_FULL_44_24]|uniref:HTH HARE-type domain-containing protein n=1 Tax=Candidatus Terrybacteria bacterium RIFCSPHIGHO2_01_FULL_43_35 TaxID=1802361 RepID=A0A1G2PFD1_9BACT|nr:MAG: hypothetical protein A2828_03690 [Candidatus Terrybacteria bacterium RIFCSPHIGHO2_01_FULL_43_35]OHA49957.1 MAG: hypothetical protein A3B75_03610 [Candidatus Terrybacteria bacterium RIFCSPHIGHO2_02_FULL_43_14]OHA51721.1 MAG: hypothetical protein A3A80_01315 [Candidatus Terrybacteria bacterium RIFCSPLOWO2_01_FULL_44_24]
MVEQNYNKIVNSLLRTLPDRGREVLERRYGIVGDPETLEAIGEDFSVTRERVRQIEEAAFAQLRKAEEMKELEDIFSYLYRHINDYGEHRREERLLNDFPGQKNSPAIIFLLDLGNDFKRRNETEKHYTLWTVNPTRLAHLEGFIGAVEQRLEEISKPLNNVNFWKEVDKISRKTKLSLSKKATESWLDISKSIVQNRFNEWGLSSWPEILPKSVGDKAYIVLRRENKPLHFAAIVDRMNKVHFSPSQNIKVGVRSNKPAHVQTVHNELIKDNRFVLVGRGIYALHEWGYEPGTVKDVLSKVLKDAGQPLPVNKIIAQVAKVRWVKPNTVMLNLQNKRLFSRTSRGEYTLRKA